MTTATTSLAVAFIGTRPQLCVFCGEEFQTDGFGLVEIMAHDLSPVCRPCGEVIDWAAVEMLDRVIRAAGSHKPDGIAALVQKKRENAIASTQ
jgi:hypothetical protein